MAAENVPELDLAALELLRLERQEEDLSRALDVITSRNERFPNVVTEERLETMQRCTTRSSAGFSSCARHSYR